MEDLGRQGDRRITATEGAHVGVERIAVEAEDHDCYYPVKMQRITPIFRFSIPHFEPGFRTYCASWVMLKLLLLIG
jgi:hypothetical protein